MRALITLLTAIYDITAKSVTWIKSLKRRKASMEELADLFLHVIFDGLPEMLRNVGIPFQALWLTFKALTTISPLQKGNNKRTDSQKTGSNQRRDWHY